MWLCLWYMLRAKVGQNPPPTWDHFPCLMPISGSGSEGVWEAHVFRLVLINVSLVSWSLD